MPRYTKPVTAKDLTDTIDQLIHKNQDLADDIENLLICAEECTGTSLLEKDLSKFYFENVLLKNTTPPSHPVYHLLGVTQIGQVRCLGILIGTDYGTPFYAVLYLDDKGRPRGYIPKAGNAINPLTKQPFGDGDIDDDQIARRLGYASYRDMDYNQPSVQAHFYKTDLLEKDISGRIQLRA
ncbi:hypothetical protein [Evansella clarkii]|uniref:hypothetical protein n=1 Tax=Evansella clarkii TaxID=79879 RepID=UPI00099674F1|nr:hypothetical protein [Evansella clarkii]